MSELQLCDISALPETGVIPVTGKAGSCIVVCRSGVVAVYENVCPHISISLNIFDDQDLTDLLDEDLLVCSNHGARFRIVDGLCVSGPCQGKHLAHRPFSVLDGKLLITTGS